LISPRSTQPEPLWRAPSGRRLVYPWATWSPDGRAILAVAAAGYPAATYSLFLLSRGGRLRQSLPGRPVAFFADGRLVLTRQRALFTLARGRVSLFVSAAAIESAAGFRGVILARGLSTMGDYGRNAIAFVVHSPGFREIVLVAFKDGKLARASPVFTKPGEVESAAGNLFWSPDGRTLFELNTRPSTGHWDHDHCLDLWSRTRGFRRIFCGVHRPHTAGHFDKLRWAPDGRTALLNNGWIVDRRGRLLARMVRGPNAAFAVSWR
jgi:hypothetical protein